MGNNRIIDDSDGDVMWLAEAVRKGVRLAISRGRDVSRAYFQHSIRTVYPFALAAISAVRLALFDRVV